jgi:uncharacterized protein (DUF2252 family)
MVHASEFVAPVAHPDVATRVARGKAARRNVPRSSLAAWEPPQSRPDPVALLREQETTRVPELIAIRHERMLASPFAFYRGAAVIMANDLAPGPQSGLWVQCCGDAHLSNFGGFATPERSFVFDINDFDETSRGPFEWDVKRLAASFEIAGRSLGRSVNDVRAASLEVGRAYRLAMTEFASMTNLGVVYARLDFAALGDRIREVFPGREDVFERASRKARTKDNIKALRKLTTTVDGEIRFRSEPPLLVPMSELLSNTDHQMMVEWLYERIQEYFLSLPDYRRRLLESYRVVDFARKVVGVGSVGTRCWVALLLGRDNDDPLFLQFKEAQSSVFEPYVGESQYGNHGQRVVEGQRLLQAGSDIALGWLRAKGVDGVERDYYVRQLWDWKLSVDIETLAPEELKFYATMCAWPLARAHAVSGDAIAIASYLGTSDRFDVAIADFAAAYADQNQRDFDVVSAQVAAGLF